VPPKKSKHPVKKVKKGGKKHQTVLPGITPAKAWKVREKIGLTEENPTNLSIYKERTVTLFSDEKRGKGTPVIALGGEGPITGFFHAEKKGKKPLGPIAG